MRERTKSWRCFAASYSAFSDRAPCAAAAASSLGSSKVSSYFRSASSFLSLPRTGRSMADPSGGGLGDDPARQLAGALAVEAARVMLAQRVHDRSELARRAGRDRGPDRLLELGGARAPRGGGLPGGAPRRGLRSP